MARLGLLATALFGLLAVIAPILLGNSDMAVPASVLSLLAALACYELIYQRSRR